MIQVYQKSLNSAWMPIDQNRLRVPVRLIASYATMVGLQSTKAHCGAYLFLSPLSIGRITPLTHMI